MASMSRTLEGKRQFGLRDGFFLAAVLFAPACSKSSTTSDATTGGSCLSSTASDCTNYQASLADLGQVLCSSSILGAGTYSTSSCSTLNLVGTCDGDELYYSTGTSPYTTSSALSVCSLGAGTFQPGSGWAAGPIDGNWVISNITCNGVAGNSSIQSSYTGSSTQEYSIYNTIGLYSFTSAGCTLEIATTFSYSGSQVSMTESGLVGCNPTGCNAACMSSGTFGPFNYNYNLSGNTLTWTTFDTSDGTCLDATPAQANPVEYTFVLH